MDLSKYFSKRPFLQVGVDIGLGTLKIALLQISPERTRLLSYKCEDISHFKEGEERNGFILQQVEDFIKAHGLFSKDIHLNLPITNAIYTKTIKLPRMPVREIPKATKWQIKDEIPVDIEEMEFAWRYAIPQIKPSKPHINIICVAVKKDFLNRYVELFRRVNISLSEITISPFSINAILPVEDIPVAILDIGYRQSIFSMHFKGKLLFLRTIHVGADNFKSAQQDQLKANVEHLCDEIVRSTKYCELEFTKQAINRIYLTGGGAKLETLSAQLQEVSGLDIKILRFPRNIQVDENIRKGLEASRDSLRILPAVGAAVSSVSKIDILPIEVRTAKLLLAQKISFRLIGLTIMLILLLSSFAVRFQVNIVKNRLSNAKAELTFLSEAEILKKEIDGYNKVIDKMKREHVPPEWALKFIGSIIPENMVLDSFIFSNKDRYANLTGTIYIKSGSAEKAITEFTRNLKQIEIFEDARIVSIERVTSGYSRFDIVCDLPPHQLEFSRF